MELTFIVTALLIIGAHTITREEHAFGFVERAWRFVPDGQDEDGRYKFTSPWYSKPISECPTCMSSVWGFGGFLFTSVEWYWIPVWCVCLAGFINLLTSIAWREE